MEIKKDFWRFILNYEEYKPFCYEENGEYYIGIHHKITDKERKFLELYPPRLIPSTYLTDICVAMNNGTLEAVEKENSFMPMKTVFKLFKSDLINCLRNAITYFDADGVTLTDTQSNALMSFLFSGGSLHGCPENKNRVGDFIYREKTSRRYYEKLLFEGKYEASQAIYYCGTFDPRPTSGQEYGQYPSSTGLNFGDYYTSNNVGTVEYNGLHIPYITDDKAVWDGDNWIHESREYNGGAFPTPVGEPNSVFYPQYGNTDTAEDKTTDVDTNLPGDEIMNYNESIADSKNEGDINTLFKRTVVTKSRTKSMKVPPLDLKLIEMVNVPVSISIPKPVGKSISFNVPVPIPVGILAQLFSFDKLLGWLKSTPISMPEFYQEETNYYTSPLKGTPTMKLKDSYGDGWFKASRNNGTKAHSGMDIVPVGGDNNVYAPADGVIKAIVYCKKDSTKFYYVWIQPTKYPELYIGLKYVTLDSTYKKVGAVITMGEKIGVLTTLTPEYPNVAKHLHIEIAENGYTSDCRRLNPMKLIYGDRQKITTQATDFEGNKMYYTGDIVLYDLDGDGIKDEITCIRDHTSGTDMSAYITLEDGTKVQENTLWNPQPVVDYPDWESHHVYSMGDKVYDKSSQVVTEMWTTNHQYYINDIVQYQYNGNYKKCIQGHISGSSFDDSKWTNYDMRILRTCIDPHTSKENIMEDYSKWTPEAERIWASNVTYMVGDRVRDYAYSQTVRTCVVTHHSGTSIINDGTYWYPSPNNEWQPNVAYAVDDIVSYGNATYKCIHAISTNEKDYFEESDWNNLDNTPSWSANTDYAVDNVVIYEGVNYRCVKAHKSGATFALTQIVNDIDTNTATAEQLWVR